MRWAGHMASMGERRSAYMALLGKPGGKSNFEELEVDVRIIL
jgi:hypothetical protein